MATLEFCDKHNMVAYLEKPEGSAEFHQIIDFQTASHIHYALTENPTIYASFIKQFWTTATASTNVNGEVELTASIDGQAKTITEASLSRHLKLEDNGGITSLPNIEIFEQLALMAYATDSDKLTFQKVTRGYSGEDIPLFPSMITAPETSPSRITSSPSLSPQHTPVSAPSTSPPAIIETTPTVEEPLTNKVGSLDNELTNTKKVYGSAITKLVKRVKKLEKQGRSLIEELDMDADFSLVPPHDAEIQEKISDDTKVLLEEEETTELIKEPTELVEDQGSGEKGEQEVTTADTALNTASVPFSTTSATTKKSKKQVQEERLGYEEAIRLQEQIDEEERKRIARDAEIAKQLPRSVAEVRKNMIMYWKNQGGYKMKDFKGMSYDDIRPIFEQVWNQIHSFVPIDSEKEVQILKRAGQDAEAKPAKRQRTEEVLESVQEQTDELSQEQLNQMVIIVPDEVHHVSTEKGQDIFMLVEKDYPLTKGLGTLMLSNKLRVDQQSEMADELLTKIYNIANKSRK
ncbi:hypothetical protein Tco_0369960 [Tanacetum coccineum]